LPDGHAAVLVPTATGLELRQSSDITPRTFGDFQNPVPLFGPGGMIGLKMPDSALLALTAVTLQVFFHADGKLSCAVTNLPVTTASNWTTTTQPLAGSVRLHILGGSTAVPTVLVLQHEGGKTGSNIYRAAAARQTLEVREIFRAPDYVAGATAVIDGQDRLHLTWSEAAPEQPIKYRVFAADGKPLGEPLVFLNGGQQPTLSLQGDNVLIACEAQAGGIAVRRITGGQVQGPVTLDGRMHFRPAFTRDANGVTWLFALDADRRTLLYRRLLGHDLSAENIAYSVQGRWVHDFAYTLPPQLGSSAPGFSLLHHEDLPEHGAPRFRFDLLPVPNLAVTDARRVLFIDLLEVAELDNVVQRLGIATKSDTNPLDLNGGAGSADEAWVNYADVMFDQGLFRMWYSTNTNTFERNWNIAYAESEDGIRWTKPNLGVVPYHGSKANNLLFPSFKDPATEYRGRNAAVGLVVKDGRETDATRRYKMLFISDLGGADAVYLTWSADGIHWNLPPARLWGKSPGKNQVIRGQTPWVEPLSSFFYDPIEPREDYRWKMYGIDAYAGHPHMGVNTARSMGVVHGATPYDFTPYPHNPVIDPRSGADEDQNHGGLVQVYEGMYVSLYQHWSGADWNVDLRLAASRDGLHFTRILPEQPLLPRGPLGAWDSGMLCTPNSLVLHDDHLWLYYRGSVGTITTGRALSQSNYAPAKNLCEPWRVSTGLARLRRDGFTYLTVAPIKRAGNDFRSSFITDYQVELEARVRTIPINATGIGSRTLHVNVGTLAPRFAWLKAQLRDAATGEVLPGYGFADCDPVEEDRLDHTFTWKGSPSLAAVKAVRIQVEFLLFGTLESPRLHSFWFE